MRLTSWSGSAEQRGHLAVWNLTCSWSFIVSNQVFSSQTRYSDEFYRSRAKFRAKDEQGMSGTHWPR
jgi:hypothetical protein